jgi:hypothetical protein
MRVRLTSQISGTRDGRDWPAPGTVVDLPDYEARALLAGGTAVEEGSDQGPKVLVPPMGVHTPGVTAMGGTQTLVEAPADAVSDPEGVRQALKDRAEGNVTEVPSGVGVQDRAGLAMTAEGVRDAVKAEEQTREALAAASAPQVGEPDKSATATKSAAAKPATK